MTSFPILPMSSFTEHHNFLVLISVIMISSHPDTTSSLSCREDEDPDDDILKGVLSLYRHLTCRDELKNHLHKFSDSIAQLEVQSLRLSGQSDQVAAFDVVFMKSYLLP